LCSICVSAKQKNPLLLIKSLDKIFILTLTPKLSKMKKITLTLSIIALSAVFSNTVVGQLQPAEATAVATTQVVSPLSIVKVRDLNFGTFSTDLNGGTITLAAVSSSAPAVLGTGLRMINSTLATSAQFLVSGTDNFIISLPTLPITLTGLNTSNTMTITSLVSSGSSTGNGLVQAVYVGGTLTVPTTVQPDIYSNLTDLKVTVNYN
jgi:hypothetical protein